LTDQYYQDSVDFFEFVIPAEVMGIFPSVTVGSSATIVTVTGTGFAATDHLGCKIWKARTPAIFVSSSSILCTVERHAPGKVSLQVTVNGVDYTAEGLVFEYLADIGVRALKPSTGSNVGGYSVTVEGSGFDSRLQLVCLFGPRRSEALVVNSTSVICKVPAAGSDQSLRVRLVDGAHVVNARETQGALFEFSAAVSIHTLLPSIGLAGESGIVFVVGTAFRAGRMVACKFGGEVS